VRVDVEMVVLRRHSVELRNLVIHNPDDANRTWKSPYFLRLKEVVIRTSSIFETASVIFPLGDRYGPHKMINFGCNTRACDQLFLSGLYVYTEKSGGGSNSACLAEFSVWYNSDEVAFAKGEEKWLTDWVRKWSLQDKEMNGEEDVPPLKSSSSPPKQGGVENFFLSLFNHTGDENDSNSDDDMVLTKQEQPAGAQKISVANMPTIDNEGDADSNSKTINEAESKRRSLSCSPIEAEGSDGGSDGTFSGESVNNSSSEDELPRRNLKSRLRGFRQSAVEKTKGALLKTKTRMTRIGSFSMPRKRPERPQIKAGSPPVLSLLDPRNRSHEARLYAAVFARFNADFNMRIGHLVFKDFRFVFKGCQFVLQNSSWEVRAFWGTWDELERIIKSGQGKQNGLVATMAKETALGMIGYYDDGELRHRRWSTESVQRQKELGTIEGFLMSRHPPKIPGTFETWTSGYIVFNPSTLVIQCIEKIRGDLWTHTVLATEVVPPKKHAKYPHRFDVIVSAPAGEKCLAFAAESAEEMNRWLSAMPAARREQRKVY